MEIINSCRVEYKYRFSDLTPIISNTSSSNIVKTLVIQNRLLITKYVDKKCSYSLEELTYTTEIENISSMNIKNIFFTDNIPKGTRFIENSVKINNKKERCLNPILGFYLKNIKVREKIIISFNVLIISRCKGKLKNISNAIYDYIYNAEKCPIRIDLNSNLVLTNYKNNLIKDFLLFSKVETRCSISKISNIKSEITVIESKFINSFIKNKVKVLVLGKIKYKIFYKSYKKMRYLEKTIGFSESMLLPIEASYLDKIQIKIKSKDLVLNIKENKKIFLSNNLVLYY